MGIHFDSPGVKSVAIDTSKSNGETVYFGAPDVTNFTLSGAGGLSFLGLAENLTTFDAAEVGGDITIGVNNAEASWWNPKLVSSATITTGQGNDYLNFSRSTGDLKINAGAGDDTIYGGSGADTFVFSAGYGKDTIRGFEIGKDEIDLSELGVAALAPEDIAMSDGNTVVTVAGGTITLIGVSGVTNGDFNFVSA
ncbi:MAG: hypothetical protein IR164_00015 [Devosia sp.]|uniref:M10 family metallopeptidase C-terminal domain-containing protein n=1 Tax=Devosia sp. TaxID=1871048 RepID=UPI0019FB8629|nr:hypothetical protein [Devosia sp.]MBF0677302.1 hypothetical protein [Devosia sp.]